MSAASLNAMLEREQAHAAASFVLDEELGTHHGLSWTDFVMLQCLAGEGGGIPEPRLASQLGVRRSKLLMRVRPLEKLGLVCRSAGIGGATLMLSAGGRRVLREARETAAQVCSQVYAQECVPAA